MYFLWLVYTTYVRAGHNVVMIEIILAQFNSLEVYLLLSLAIYSVEIALPSIRDEL